MTWLADPSVWIGLFTLVVLEIVLGIDNLVFIAILVNKLPPAQRDRARMIGLGLALVMRMVLLATMSWLIGLTKPLLTLGPVELSGRSIILLLGGFFLLFKATSELHERLDGQPHDESHGTGHGKFWNVIAQVVILDAVFSIDSVITAVGMVNDLPVMMAAVVIAMGAMLFASRPLTHFVNAHRTVVVLCLSFLLMIGFSLVAEGLGFHIPKGYLYAAIGFSILIELLNQLARLRRKKSLQGLRPMRERTAHAVMRLLGGRQLNTDEVGEDIADLMEGGEDEQVFHRRERIMISGVLQLAERPIRGVMTPRGEVDYIDLSDPAEVIREKLMHSSYSRLPLIREGGIDEPLGFVHKKELLKELLAGHEPDLEAMARKPLNLLESFTILNALEQMRKESTHIAFVVNEFGDFIGVLTMTDILESIAGELPDASEIEGPNIVSREDGYLVSGGLNLSQVRQQTGFPASATDDYQTLAGMVMSLLDRLPTIGDTLIWEGWRLTVTEVEERRVKRVLLSAL